MNPIEKRLLVTAALPYANGKIHLGHISGAYLPSDIYVRFHRSMKHDVLFICGSDEHGVPITITADQEHISPQEVVDRYHAVNKKAFERLGVSFDHYSRTSATLHHETAREVFLALHAAGVLNEKKEKQLFDEKAGMFLPDRYVEGTCPVCQNPEARGDQCERCGTYLSPVELVNPKSKISGETPSVRETAHWYFPLGRFQERLQSYIRERNERDGWKESVIRYCESWFKEGLTDRAVTRDLKWGVKIPLEGYEDKVLYVWFDAVLGYISASKEWANTRNRPESWRPYWMDEGTKYVAFIGKDNIVFHCIVFPAMLMAWNDTGRDAFILPENVPANEFLNFEGQKFSKSRGWGIDVDDFLDLFPPDMLRYTLAMNLPEARDADFTWREFQSRSNNELADILGNFVNRALTFLHRNYDGAIPSAPTSVVPTDSARTSDEQLIAEIALCRDEAGALFERYRFRDGTARVMNLARFANKYFNDQQPWKTLKENPDRCAHTINLCVQTIRSLAILFEPILPHTSARLWHMLNLDGSPSADGWQTAAELKLQSGHKVRLPEIIFEKLEDERIENAKRMTMPDTPIPGAPPDATPAETKYLTIDDFKKVELRTARIISAERVPKSQKLLKIQVSIGSETRQVIAGIGQHYQPEDLPGKHVVVVANLQPATLMGHQSQGMLLAASDNQGRLALVTPMSDVDEASLVK